MRGLRITPDELDSVRFALTELECSVEPGGANEGQEAVFEQCAVLAAWASRAEGQYPVLTSEGEIDALEAAVSELRWQTEQGGVHDQDADAEAHLSRAEAVTTKWGLAEPVLAEPSRTDSLGAQLHGPRG